MPGDFSRIAFVPSKGYVGVLMQQGRVQLDYDWNQQVDILQHRLGALTRDVVGPEGAPRGAPGFAVAPRDRPTARGPHVYAEIHDAAPLDLRRDQPFSLEVTADATGVHASGTLCACEPSRYRLGVDDERALVFEIGGRTFVGDTPLPSRVAHIEVRSDGERVAILVDGRRVGSGDLQEAGAGGEDVRPDGDLRFFIGGGPAQAAPFAGAIYRVSLRAAARRGAPLEHAGDFTFDEADGGAVVDRASSERRGRLVGMDSSSPASELWIGAGRYYVDGADVECFRSVPFDAQPYFPGARIPVGTSLAYLDSWDEIVSALEDESLRDPALGGLDTTVRERRVWQVRCLPIEANDEGDSRDLEHRWDELVRWYDGKTRMRACRDDRASEPVENLLYRVEIQSPGAPYVGGAPPPSPLDELVVSAMPSPLGASRVAVRDWGPLGFAPQPGQIVQILGRRPRDAEGADVARAVFAAVRQVDVAERVLTLELSTPVILEVGTRLRRTATFTWSRNNGLDVFVVESVGKEISLANEVRAGGAPLQEGDIVTLESAATRLLMAAPQFAEVVKADGRSVRLSPELEAPDAWTRPWLLRRWDNRIDKEWPKTTRLVAAGEWLELERGIRVWFARQGRLQRGDFWAFPSRTALGGIEWPDERREKPDGGSTQEPRLEPPNGVWHRLARLAKIDASSRRVRTKDLRRVFDPLGDTGAANIPSGFLLPSPSRISPPGWETTDWYVDAKQSGPRWTQGPALPVDPTLQIALLLCEGRLYALTERGDLFRLDESTERWTPRCRADVQRGRGFGAGVYAGRIYYIGGAAQREQPTSYEFYSPDHDRWSDTYTPSRLPPGLTDFGVATLEQGTSSVMLIAGGTSHAHGDVRVVDGVWVYFADEGAEGAWRDGPALLAPRTALALVSVGGVAYAIGGRDADSNPSTSNAALDWFSRSEVARAWRPRASLAAPRAEAASVALAGRVHLVGGRIASGDPTESHEVYDPSTDVWMSAPALRAPRVRAGLAPYEDGLLLAGGSVERAASVVEQYRQEQRLYLHRRRAG
ncbi:MAG: DUF6519 domain-containing protein [Polyangiaceae bacterium]